MLANVERLVDLGESRESGLVGAPLRAVEKAVQTADIARLQATDGHFAAVARDEQTVRLGRTLGLPLRYFVAKRYHGPFLVVADRDVRVLEKLRESQSDRHRQQEAVADMKRLDEVAARQVPAEERY